MMNKNIEFKKNVEDNISKISKDDEFKELTIDWLNNSIKDKYVYNFTWMDRPIIQYPQDIVAMQEIIWKVKPDIIIESGIAHGGGLLLYASLLSMIGNGGKVVGLEQHIFPEFREEIEKSCLIDNIVMIEGDSVSDKTVNKVYELAKGAKKVLIALDSNHTHEHVLNELNKYSPLVKNGSYIVVFDTIVNVVSDEFNANKPWSKGKNPMTAVNEFLSHNDRFEVDNVYNQKLLITSCPSGYLKCIKD